MPGRTVADGERAAPAATPGRPRAATAQNHGQRAARSDQRFRSIGHTASRVLGLKDDPRWPPPRADGSRSTTAAPTAQAWVRISGIAVLFHSVPTRVAPSV